MDKNDIFKRQEFFDDVVTVTTNVVKETVDDEKEELENIFVFDHRNIYEGLRILEVA